jgi:hypothetical protein
MGINYAILSGMLWILTSALGVASFSTLALMVRKAPEGYETKDGFHVIRRASQVKRHRQAPQFAGTPAHRSV